MSDGMSNFKHEINIDRIACPLHVLQIKQGMKKIQAGENLKINSNDFVMPELLAAARQIGSKTHVSSDNNTLLITK
jgi:TusA-related sulfurtransferase